MVNKKHLAVLSVAVIVIMAILAPVGCKGSPSPGRPGGTAINSDSIVTVQIKEFRKQSSGYPWEVDVLIQTSSDVDTLPNPTKNSIGKVITVKTDTDITRFKAGDIVTAKIKTVADVKAPGGVSLYMYNITSNIPPQY